MNLNYRLIVNILGGMLMVLAVTFVFPMFISLIYLEVKSAGAFYLMFLLTAAIGAIMRKLTVGASGKLRVRDGFFVVAAIWIIVPLLGCMPYVISGAIPSLPDAIFESCSGFSTTGATILDSDPDMDRGMLLWRSFTQWLGGFGTLALVPVLIPWLNRNRQNIIIEATSTQQKTDQGSVTIAHMTVGIYIILSILMITAMLMSGTGLMDAICHTFSTVSTGGFSIHSTGMDYFTASVKNITIVFMFLSAISCNLYIMTVKHGLSTLVKNSEFKLYVLIIAVASILIGISLSVSRGFSWHVAGTSVFQAVSIISTTGYATSDYTLWPSFAMSIVFALFFIGGCMGSAAGGIKVYRVLLIFKLLKRSIGIRLHPNAIINIHVQGRPIVSDTIIKATSFVLLYFTLLLGGSLLLSLDNLDFMTTISSAASCLGNIGPAFGLAGPALNYCAFSGFSKLTLSFLMIAGRLELFTFLAVFTPVFWDPDRF